MLENAEGSPLEFDVVSAAADCREPIVIFGFAPKSSTMMITESQWTRPRPTSPRAQPLNSSVVRAAAHGLAATRSLTRLNTVDHSAVSVQIQASKSIMPL